MEDDGEQCRQQSPTAAANSAGAGHGDGVQEGAAEVIAAKEQQQQKTPDKAGASDKLPVGSIPCAAAAARDVPEGVLQARQPPCDNGNKATAAAEKGDEPDKARAEQEGGDGLSSGSGLLQSQVARYDLSAVVRHKGPLASSGHFVADVKNSKVRGGKYKHKVQMVGHLWQGGQCPED